MNVWLLLSTSSLAAILFMLVQSITTCPCQAQRPPNLEIKSRLENARMQEENPLPASHDFSEQEVHHHVEIPCKLLIWKPLLFGLNTGADLMALNSLVRITWTSFRAAFPLLHATKFWIRHVWTNGIIWLNLNHHTMRPGMHVGGTDSHLHNLQTLS